MKHLILLSMMLFSVLGTQTKDPNSTAPENEELDYKKSLVSYADFKKLLLEVEDIRAERLISFDELLELQKDEETVILDTRSREKFAVSHMKGAINLPYTEFTTFNLRQIVPNTDARIIIYCNNNFEGDQFAFASKMYDPIAVAKRSFAKPRSGTMLALNVPTYITLAGYGYTNIYELDELVNINDSRLKLELNSNFPRLIALPSKDINKTSKK